MIIINSNSMKHYYQPETKVLQVMNNGIICASAEPGPGPAPAPSVSGQLGTMERTTNTW